MTFIDTSVITELLDDDKAIMERTRILLESLVCTGRLLVTSTLVLNEILQVIQRPKALWRFIDNAFESVISVDISIMKAAYWIMQDSSLIPLRIAVHAATIRQYGISEIFTYDDGFVLIPDISRIGKEL